VSCLYMQGFAPGCVVAAATVALSSQLLWHRLCQCHWTLGRPPSAACPSSHDPTCPFGHNRSCRLVYHCTVVGAPILQCQLWFVQHLEYRRQGPALGRPAAKGIRR
jgi:hypothetical protein